MVEDEQEKELDVALNMNQHVTRMLKFVNGKVHLRLSIHMYPQIMHANKVENQPAFILTRFLLYF